MSCPGPHQLCRGCGGTGTVHGSAVYVSDHGAGESVAAPHGCRHCRDRGFACQATTPCDGEHHADTPLIRLDRRPPA
ncbi:hypothetical protein DTL70_24165 [Streptomyces diacarni]|uniref:Uncharacterized protein n=1 Tax=Streptomyces diacarni TaxID=2800381 RepID=A0A367ENY0_9ACTN|nr:hypothetical protein [Streptomyces diacarni]RCG19806.1 hypothetical protein DTL70_24165 [Streptomyces diacarni]